MKPLSELKISPAPWKFIHDDVVDDLECGVVYSNDCSYLGVADGNLIAAAPKMYQKLMEAVEDKCCFCTASEDERRELCDLCIVADWKARRGK